MKSIDSPGLSDRAIRAPGGSSSSKPPSTAFSQAVNKLFKLPLFSKLQPPDQVRVLRNLLAERKSNRQPGEVDEKGKLRPALSPLPQQERAQAEAVQKLVRKGSI